MENIGKFLEFCDSMGVPKTDVFQTVDLYEGQNIPQVSWYDSLPYSYFEETFPSYTKFQAYKLLRS